jgi:hypothetical protein
MATYNVTDGTGGLDASTRFEQDRPEVSVSLTGMEKKLTNFPVQNAGTSIRDTDLFLTASANRYVSGKRVHAYL